MADQGVSCNPHRDRSSPHSGENVPAPNDKDENYEIGAELVDEVQLEVIKEDEDYQSTKNDTDIELSVADDASIRVSSMDEEAASLDEAAPLHTQHKDEYIKPIEDPYEKATKYLSKHDILPLFQVLTAGIAYKRPGDPLEYMITEIENIRDLDQMRKGVVKRTPAGKDSVMRNDAV